MEQQTLFGQHLFGGPPRCGLRLDTACACLMQQPSSALRAGKSLTVHEALRRTWRAERAAGRPAPRLVSINCMTLRQPTEVYARIAASLAAPPASADEPIAYPGAAHLGHRIRSTSGTHIKRDCCMPDRALQHHSPLFRHRRLLLSQACALLMINDAAAETMRMSPPLVARPWSTSVRMSPLVGRRAPSKVMPEAKAKTHFCPAPSSLTM